MAAAPRVFISYSHDSAEHAASLVAMTEQIYLAVVIARLVGIQSSPPPAGHGTRGDETGEVERAIRPGPGGSRRQKSEVDDERPPR